jgi:hypothetical protein
VTVVTAPVRGCREPIVEGSNGVLIAGRSESVWAARLEELLRSPHSSWPREDREASHRLRRSLWVSEMLNTYQEVLQRNRAPRPTTLTAPSASYRWP